MMDDLSGGCSSLELLTGHDSLPCFYCVGGSSHLHAVSTPLIGRLGIEFPTDVVKLDSLLYLHPYSAQG